jgi:hypothetical protein
LLLLLLGSSGSVDKLNAVTVKIRPIPNIESLLDGVSEHQLLLIAADHAAYSTCLP